MKKFLSLLESTALNSPIEFDNGIYYFNNISENEFNIFNKDNLYSILRPSEIKSNSKIYSYVLKKEDFKYIISSVGVLKFKDVFQDFINFNSLDVYHDLNQKGIVFFKKRNLDLIKKYDNIKDLSGHNIGLFTKKEEDEIKIIVYEIDVFNKPIQSLALKSILFYCSITTGIKFPFGGSTIIKTVSRKDVNGQKIMYPFAIYFADNSILISDRFKVSELAKKVWKDFYSHQNVLYPFAPIDNKKFPLTPQKEDDGFVHSLIKEDLEKIINQKFTDNKKTFLLKILECENENDLKKIEQSLPSDIKLLVNNLHDLHKKINTGVIYKFIYDLILDHFKVDLSDIRKTNYLDWAYKINPGTQTIIKTIINELLVNHLENKSKDRDSKLIDYAEILWEHKGGR
jgi:hypothetical protein